MADTPEKAPGKTGENTLNLLATLGTLGGQLFFGPDFQGDIGAPFRAGAQILQQKREAESLRKILGTTEPTANFLDHADALHEAGGLVNNPDILDHPELKDAFKLNEPPSVLNTLQNMGPQLDTGNQNLNASAPSPASLPSIAQQPAPAPTPTPTQTPTAPSNPGSSGSMINPADPEFLRRASIYDPTLARQIVLDRASQKTSPLDDVMKMFGIQEAQNKLAEHQTPEEKAQSDIEQKVATEKALAPIRQGEKQQEKQDAAEQKRSVLLPAETATQNAISQAVTHLQSLPDTLSNRTFMAANVAKYSPTSASLIDPDYAKIAEGVAATKAKISESIKGSRFGPKMLDALTPSVPDMTKNPAVWKATKQQAIARYTLAGLVHDANLAIQGRTKEGIPVSQGGTPVMPLDQAKEVQGLVEGFEKYGNEARKSPTFNNLIHKYNLDNLFINTTPNQ